MCWEELGMGGPRNVEEYLAALPEESRAALLKLRKMIRDAAPEATETISYQMPAFKDGDRLLVSYAAFKDHYSLFPMSLGVIDANLEELKPYLSGRATLRFDRGKPPPASL